MSGASGLLGPAIAKALAADGAVVTRLVRCAATKPNQITWEAGKPLTVSAEDQALMRQLPIAWTQRAAWRTKSEPAPGTCST